MKLNVKTLKGTSFEIEASPEETVRPPFLPRPSLVFCSLQSERFRAIRGRVARFGAALRGDCAPGRWGARGGGDLNLGFLFRLGAD